MPDLFPPTEHEISDLVTINAIEALEDLCRKFDLDDVRLSAPMARERYGFKSTATVFYHGVGHKGVVVALLPRHGTGVKPPASNANAGHLVLRAHDANAHEFVFNLSHPEGNFVERYSSQHNMGRCPQLLCAPLFASHYTQYELEDELYANLVEPQGITFRAHDIHALHNPSDKHTIPLLVLPIPKGEKLIQPFHHFLLENSGERFTLNIDERNGNII